MSEHDPQATLLQMQDAALRLQTICTGKTLDGLLADWQATAAYQAAAAPSDLGGRRALEEDADDAGDVGRGKLRVAV